MGLRQVLGLLLTWCFVILKPFVAGNIGQYYCRGDSSPLQQIAITSGKLPKTRNGNLTILLLALLAVPSVELTSSLLTGVTNLRAELQEGKFRLAPPPDKVADWPVVGKPLHERPYRAAALFTLHEYGVKL